MTGLMIYPKRKLRKLLQEGEYAEAIEFGKSLEQKFAKDFDYTCPRAEPGEKPPGKLD